MKHVFWRVFTGPNQPDRDAHDLISTKVKKKVNPSDLRTAGLDPNRAEDNLIWIQNVVCLNKTKQNENTGSEMCEIK